MARFEQDMQNVRTIQKRTKGVDEMKFFDTKAKEAGQGLAEVALILALVVVVAIVALQLLGTNITNVLNQVAQAI